MGTLTTAPGVLRAATTTYVNVKNVMRLLGCKENKAYETIRAINHLAKEAGMMAYGQGKASKYMFAEQFGIPMDVVNAVIEENGNKEV